MTIVEVIDPGNDEHMAVWKEFRRQCVGGDPATASQWLAACFDPPISSGQALEEEWPQGWMLSIEAKIRKRGEG